MPGRQVGKPAERIIHAFCIGLVIMSLSVLAVAISVPSGRRVEITPDYPVGHLVPSSDRKGTSDPAIRTDRVPTSVPPSEPESGPEAESDGDDASETELALIGAVNAERGAAGLRLARLARDPRLSSSAQERSDDMAARDYLDHYTPEGLYGPRTALEHGYDYRRAGEVISAGWDTPGDVVAAWMASDTHRAVLLDQDFEEVGFGISVGTYRGYPGQTIVVGHFGVLKR